MVLETPGVIGDVSHLRKQPPVEFFCLTADCSRIWLRIDDIAWIETPGPVHRQVGWPSEFAAYVQIKGRSDGIALDEIQLAQLRERLGL